MSKQFIVISLSVLSLFISACGEEETRTKSASKENQETHVDGDQQVVPAAPNVVVKGTVKNGAKASLVLEAQQDQKSLVMGQTFTDANGDFFIEAEIKGLGIYQLRLEQQVQQVQRPKVIPLTLVPGDTAVIALDFENFERDPLYGNTDWADAMTRYMEEVKKFTDWQKTLGDPNQYSQESYMEMAMKQKKDMDDFSIAFIIENPDNPANIVLYTNLTPMAGYEKWDPKLKAPLQKMREAYAVTFPEETVAQEVIKQIDQILKGYEDYIDFMENNKAPEIAKADPKGNLRKLSDLRGKYVLIDFWASWCGPCRVENPNVVKLYNKYKSKNFDIFSVSLDNEKDRWVKAIEADGLIWENHVSDLKGWQTDVTKSYQFNGIPHTVLIDPEGKIIASNLRGPALEQKLSEVLK